MISMLDAALDYAALGYSTIPLRGKVPAIPEWKKYQHSKPSAQELRIWFEDKQYPALGILTGRSSGIIALDLDDETLRDQFAAALPHLINTRTIKTRRGFHYLFAISTPVYSRQWRGADLQADGKYVVAPPSPGYSIVEDIPLLQVSSEDVQSIVTFFCEQAAPLPALVEDTMPLLLTQASAAGNFQHRCAQLGSRNHALFITACGLRDRGAPVGWAEDALTHVYATAPALNDHLPQTFEDRQREAVTTIRSAFKRPARLIRFEVPLTNGKRIAFGDNGARERMLQQDKVSATGFWRCYDALTLEGFTGGERFTFDGIYKKISKLGVGRRALDHFIKAVSPDGEFLIFRESPSPRTPTPVPTDSKTTDQQMQENSNAAWFDLKSHTAYVHTPKRSVIESGRKARIYIFPSLDDLCSKLGLRRTVGDPISDEDVRTPRKYRAGLQREFIRRKPGRYSLGILAQRIGVSKRAIQRYHALTGVESIPTFDTLSQIMLETLDAIPQLERGAPTKFYLKDDYGKLYPAQASTAAYLIQSGRRVFLMQRGFNFYWFGDPPPEIVPALPDTMQANLEMKKQRRNDSIERISALLATREQRKEYPLIPIHKPKPRLKEVAVEEFREVGERISAILAEREEKQYPELIPNHNPPPLQQLALPYQAPPHIHEPPAPPIKRPRRSSRYFRSPLPDDYSEHLAQRLHDFTTNSSRAHGLAIYNARRIVELYGPAAVQRALSRVLWLQGKSIPMTNPTGLLISTARTNWRELHPGQSTPQFKAEKKRKGRNRYDVTQDAYWQYLKSLIVATDDQIFHWRVEAGLERENSLGLTFDELSY